MSEKYSATEYMSMEDILARRHHDMDQIGDEFEEIQRRRIAELEDFEQLDKTKDNRS